MKNCTLCNKIIERSPHANNVKYCADCRKEAYKYKEYRKKWQQNKRGEYQKGKIKCLLCGKYYRKPISHAWQVHGMNEREYKELFGLDHKKGIVMEETRETLREHVQTNYDVVVAKNLLQNGKLTRFKRGNKSLGRYKRSPQTMERLRRQGKLLAKNYPINKK